MPAAGKASDEFLPRIRLVETARAREQHVLVILREAFGDPPVVASDVRQHQVRKLVNRNPVRVKAAGIRSLIDEQFHGFATVTNNAAVREAAGSGLPHVLRTTIYLTDLPLFTRVNQVYARFFGAAPSPARATVEVSALPLGASVEMDAIAAVPEAASGPRDA